MDIQRVSEQFQSSNVGSPAMSARAVTPPVVESAASAVQVSSAAVQQISATPETHSVKQALAQVNQVVSAIAPNLQFSLDKDTGKTVVKVVDTKTNDVIRQFPSEEMLAIARAIDKLQGLLLRDKA